MSEQIPPPPRKPSNIEIWLFDAWPINRLTVETRMRNEDSADTYVKIRAGHGEEKEFKWETVEKLLKVGVDYNSVARLKNDLEEDVKKWKEFEKQNAEDLKLYSRLKQKFG